MAKSGPGRGRGWLNLKPSNPPVGEPAAPSPQVDLLTPNEEALRFVDAVEQTDLVNRINQLSVHDDGILLNQKVKYILKNWRKSCQSGDEVEQAFETLYQSCLNDSNLASKVVIMVTSAQFKTQEVHKKNIHLLFLCNLQKNFENSKSLRKTNKRAFRNSVRMLGEYFNRARSCDGQQRSFLVTPLFEYLEMLIEDAQPQDLQLFTAQLYMNGSGIKVKSPEKFTDLLNSLRSLLVSEKVHTKESKLWMLLALEVADNRFGLLPSEINKFYKDQLGDAAIASLQMIPSMLCVQTVQESKILDDYQSNISVLQLSSPLPPETTNEMQNCTNKEGNNTSKHGRPILGAGARLGKMKMESSSNKGWEHDDRFENNYS